jgi:Baseplate J-like protein
MSIQPPKIDNRSYENLVEQTVKLVQHYTARDESEFNEIVDNKVEFLRDRTLAQDIKETDGKIVTAGTLIDEALALKIVNIEELKQVSVKGKGWWKPETADAGLGLIRIFDRMAATVSDRLNRVPEKNFLAFLDLLGTQILPPQPARVPLTFFLASGVPENTTALVPAYTQISAPPVEGEKEEVLFETETDLIVTLVQLQAVFVQQLEADKYSDRTLEATGKKDTHFLAFEGDIAIEHSLYLACDRLFSLSEVKNITLNIYSAQITDLNNLQLTWYYWDNSDWQLLEKETSIDSANNRWQVTLKNLPAISPKSIDQRSARWLKVTSSSASSISIERITAGVEVQNSQLKLDACFFNTVPLDLSKDFYPFGEQPRFNDAFYLASQALFSKPGMTVKLNISIGERAVNTSGEVELAWEFYNGSSWQKIGKSSVTNPPLESQQNFSDGTQAFSKSEEISEEITVTIPDTIQAVAVNGVLNYWLRARIVKGNYGTEATYRQRTELNSVTNKNEPVYVNEVPIYELVPASILPPSIQSISLKYHAADVPLSDCLSYNNFTYQAHLTNFQPFTAPPNNDISPKLYLGFDRPFPNRSIALYFQVQLPTAEELLVDTIDPRSPSLVWEYFNGKAWTKLNAIDETAAFADRGLVKFIGPSDLTEKQEFDRTCYWLRICWESGAFRAKPCLHHILTNTIWASQTTMLHNEVLGSSNGNPNQIFRTTQSPVLPGQILKVQEQKLPPIEEQNAIERLEGKEAIALDHNETGQVETIWVRWHEVSDFYESGPRDRHYTLNRLTGEIQFGDGQYGLIPPQGRNTIRMTQYKTDGGARGNKPANAIKQLKTTIPYIDRVTNLEAASGGSDREPIDRVQERGQKFIRHRNRAVTVQDFEDLAYEASADLARVKAISPNCDPLAEELWIDPQNPNFDLENHRNQTQTYQTNAGLVKLFIIPRTSAPQPVPSLALIDRVETYLRDRASPTLKLWVGSPQWLKVSVTAEVIPTSLQVADAVRDAIVKRLEAFLHPLTGGVSGQGWEFGREPYESDFYSLIQAIDRVNYIRSLSIKLEPELFTYSAHCLIFSGSHTIHLVQGDGS